MLAYPAVLDLSPSTRDLLARAIRARRKAIGSRWRKATPGRQALLVLVHLRKGSTYTELAAAFGLGVATVYRYISEAVDVLILDGTLIHTDRLGDRAFYSGKHQQYGVNVQQVTDGRGDPVWSSPGCPAAPTT